MIEQDKPGISLVSVNLQGNKALAATHVGEARSLALAYEQNNFFDGRISNFVRRFTLADGTLIQLVVNEWTRTITILSPFPTLEELELIAERISGIFIGLWLDNNPYLYDTSEHRHIDPSVQKPFTGTIYPDTAVRIERSNPGDWATEENLEILTYMGNWHDPNGNHISYAGAPGRLLGDIEKRTRTYKKGIYAGDSAEPILAAANQAGFTFMVREIGGVFIFYRPINSTALTGRITIAGNRIDGGGTSPAIPDEFLNITGEGSLARPTDGHLVFNASGTIGSAVLKGDTVGGKINTGIVHLTVDMEELTAEWSFEDRGAQGITVTSSVVNTTDQTVTNGDWTLEGTGITWMAATGLGYTGDTYVVGDGLSELLSWSSSYLAVVLNADPPDPGFSAWSIAVDEPVLTLYGFSRDWTAINLELGDQGSGFVRGPAGEVPQYISNSKYIKYQRNVPIGSSFYPVQYLNVQFETLEQRWWSNYTNEYTRTTDFSTSYSGTELVRVDYTGDTLKEIVLTGSGTASSQAIETDKIVVSRALFPVELSSGNRTSGWNPQFYELLASLPPDYQAVTTDTFTFTRSQDLQVTIDPFNEIVSKDADTIDSYYEIESVINEGAQPGQDTVTTVTWNTSRTLDTTTGQYMAMDMRYDQMSTGGFATNIREEAGSGSGQYTGPLNTQAFSNWFADITTDEGAGTITATDTLKITTTTNTRILANKELSSTFDSTAIYGEDWQADDSSNEGNISVGFEAPSTRPDMGGVITALDGHKFICLYYTFPSLAYTDDEKSISLLYDAESGTYTEVFSTMEVSKPTGLTRAPLVDIGLF